jgi:HD-like signal output (HDOD) protein
VSRILGVKVFWKKIFTKMHKSDETHGSQQKIHEPKATTRELKAKKVKVSVSFLKRLQPIGLLAEAELKQVEVLLAEFAAREVIYKESETLAYLAYVVAGEVYCESSTGTQYDVVANTFKALYPISSSSSNLFSAIAKSPVKIIYLPASLLQESSNSQIKVDINNPIISQQLQKLSLGRNLLSILQQQTIDIPSLPDVAIRLRMAVQKDIGIAEAVKIINLDQGISAKLVQVVNSPLYCGVKPFTSCDAAVNRLGLMTTRNLVTSFSMKALFKSNNRVLTKKVQQAWQQSVTVSSLCHTLAVLTHKVDPEEALLAGLTHNIGILPIIRLADQQASYSPEELEQCIKISGAYIGQCVLRQWGFAEALVKIPYLIDNWFYESGTDFGLVDVVILAKYHSLLGTDYVPFLPALHDLPAFQKLGDNGLTPDMSLQILYDAKQQVAEAMSLFEV